MNKILDINQILNETQTIVESYDRVADVTGEKFNIFTILQIESDEVATHSRFIAELLNREGRHGQGDKFLSLFIKRFVENHDFEPGKSQVFVEYHVGKVEFDKGGRIDILIVDAKKNIIMIENKVYALEQHNQLLRYRNAFPHGKLFYLTLFGDKSIQNHSQITYSILSYETNIIEWLEDCKKESVNIPILRESISQYINLVKKLTHQNLNKKMNQDIINRILRDTNSLSAYKALFDLHKDLKRKMILSIIQNIKELFEKKGFINIQTMDFKSDKGLLISFQTEILKKKDLSLRLNFEETNFSGLIIGFANFNQTQEKDLELLQMIKNEFPKAKQSDWYNVYFSFDAYRDWHFDSLNSIYFENTFYFDLENIVDIMLAIFDQRMRMIR